jgi:hypothetical protein
MFFNVDNLDKEAKSDSKRFMQILHDHFLGRSIPKSKWSPRVKSQITGLSYMLNPAPIFNLKSVDINYLVQYVKLTALRDYSLYKLYGYAGLDLTFFPDIIYSNIKHNPLIQIVGNHIYFKYEEQYLQQKKD